MPLFPGGKIGAVARQTASRPVQPQWWQHPTVSPWIALPRRKEPNIRVPEQFAILVPSNVLGARVCMYGSLVQTFGTDLGPRHPELVLLAGFSSVGSSGT